MKRIAGLAILVVLLLHSMGYQWVNDLLLHRADQRMQARIDARQYNNDQLIELSVTLSLPYSTNWGEWEAVEGEVMVNGMAYRYVERKLENGVMHVRCLPNMERQMLAIQSFSQQHQIFPLTGTNPTHNLLNHSSTSSLDYDDFVLPYLKMPVTNAISFNAISTMAFTGQDGIPPSPPPEWT